MRSLSDGDPIMVIFRDEGGRVHEKEAEYCDPPILFEDDRACFHFFLYRPDTVTDCVPLERIVNVRPDPTRRPFGDGA